MACLSTRSLALRASDVSDLRPTQQCRHGSGPRPDRRTKNDETTKRRNPAEAGNRRSLGCHRLVTVEPYRCRVVARCLHSFVGHRRALRSAKGSSDQGLGHRTRRRTDSVLLWRYANTRDASGSTELNLSNLSQEPTCRALTGRNGLARSSTGLPARCCLTTTLRSRFLMENRPD
jgi:hypothetical protein